jgi:hypothetical protein
MTYQSGVEMRINARARTLKVAQDTTPESGPSRLIDL